MSALWLWCLALGGGLFGMWLLTRSADWFVDGAVALARRLRIPPLIIGFTIVGFGTSAPEMLISALAAAQGMPVLSLGNAYGSNITNILLILGASMLVAPIALHRTALKRDIPFLLLVAGMTVAFACAGRFPRWTGFLFLTLFGAFLAWQIVAAFRQRGPAEPATTAPFLPLGRAYLLTFGGLGALLVASQVLVWAARFVTERSAAAAGISPEATQAIIGVTVVALGTSLPELMASISAMRKGEDDIALGNVVGSNCFNLCVVAGLALVIHPVEAGVMPNAMRYRDVFVVLASSLLLWCAGAWAWHRAKRAHTYAITMGRRWGWLFLALWLAYTLWVFVGTKA